MVQFYAEVPVWRAGYRWVVDRGAWLRCVRQAATNQGNPVSHFRTYNPFDEGALFQIFANLGDPLAECQRRGTASDPEATDEFRAGVLHFVNRYGVPKPSPVWCGLVSDPSLTERIAQAVSDMRSAITLWRAVRTRDRRAIAGLIQTDRKVGWRVRYAGRTFTRADLSLHAVEQIINPEWPLPPQSSGELALALEVLQHMISESIRDHTRVRLLRPKPGILELRIEVDGLLPAMWLQLALAIVENRQYRCCARCGKPFELGQRRGRGKVRDDRQFCDVTCRVQAYKGRKRLASDLRAAKVTLRDIAKQLKTELKTVKGWLEK